MRVDLDLEPGLPHPAGRELVRLVLGRAPVRPVRARPAADRVQLLEPLENPHRAAVCRSLSAAEQPPAGERDQRGERRTPPARTSHDTVAAKSDRRGDARRGQHGLLDADRGAGPQRRRRARRRR